MRWMMRTKGWLAVALVVIVAASGCGGSAYIGITLGDDEDGTPPSVSIAANPSTVVVGGSVHLVAAAADASGIESVAFYRIDGGVPVLLGSDGTAPFEWDATAPSDGRGQVSFFARAGRQRRAGRQQSGERHPHGALRLPQADTEEWKRHDGLLRNTAGGQAGHQGVM